MSTRYVFAFEEGDSRNKMLLGGKGANLAEMTNLQLPVPAGFTISTEVCMEFLKKGRRHPGGLEDQVKRALSRVEKEMGARFGDPKNPLLMSVRSGARASMPGMMDTILNLGLNAKTVAALIAKTGKARFVYDSYRRFVQMYGDVVLGLKPVEKDEIDPFEAIIEKKKHDRAIKSDTALTAASPV